jgi:hypothetical protein
MDSRSAFLLQVLEKLASPLVASISEVAVRQMMMPDPAQPSTMRPEAEQVAGLLTKSTQMSIGLSELIDLKLPENEADSLRLALTSLSSPLVANIYRLAGRTPTDAEVDRVMAAMNAVFTYSENFTPASDATARMAVLDQDFYPADKVQVSLMYMSALLPAVNSVMAYSFGQPEKKLIQEVTERLLEEAKDLRARMFPKLKDERKISQADLAVLRMATQIYSQCHFGEMAKLMATEEQARQGLAPAMTTLWQAFSLRMEMLEILADIMVPEDEETEETAAGTDAVKPEAAVTDAKAGQDAAPVAQAVSTPATAAEAANQPGEKTAPANPMSFFVKKNTA